METRSIFISQGFWLTCYEPHDMPGASCSTRYTVTPVDGSAPLADNVYKGFVPFDNTLRIVGRGEYCSGSFINQSIQDFAIAFDETYHKEYYAGLTRGYKGKRACSFNVFCRRSQTWGEGYREGRRARQSTIQP
jgi:hypothetical protein